MKKLLSLIIAVITFYGCENVILRLWVRLIIIIGVTV